jgi:sugar diacid utilization regulator
MSLDSQFQDIAEKFLQSISQVSGCPMIVCDDRGIISSATVRSRIGQPHAGAQRIVSGEVDDWQVSAEEAAENPMVKEGYNCPMVVEGKRIGTFGIAGPLEVAKPLCRVAALVLSNLVRERRQQEAIRQAADQAFESVERLAGQVAELVGGAQGVADAITAASAQVSERVEKAEAVVGTIQRVAQQSRILSINGSVEATRAGDHGRAFAVVAKDMTRLAEETKATAAAIQTTLSEISRAITHVQEAVARSAASASEQTGALQEVTRTVADLKQAMATLESDFGGQAGEPAARRPSRSLAAHRLAGRGTSPPVAPRG